MNPDEKSQKRATDVIAAYGAEQSAWPEAERAATLDALQSSDELRQILSEEASLDSLLQQSDVGLIKQAAGQKTFRRGRPIYLARAAQRRIP